MISTATAEAAATSERIPKARASLSNAGASMAPSGKNPKIAPRVAIIITITARTIQSTVMMMPQGRGWGATVASTVMGSRFPCWKIRKRGR